MDKVVRDLKTLTVEEQQQVRDLLNSWLSAPIASEAEQQLAQELLKAGLLTRIPPPVTDLSPYQNRVPISVQGRPVSETLLEDRR